MAKPLGPKTALIRQAITANPGVQNKALAELINGSDARREDGIKVTPFEVAEQRQRMKKAGAAVPGEPAPAAGTNGAPKRRGRPKGSKRAATAFTTPQKPSGQRGPVELIDQLFELADECGGLGALKRLVDRIATAERA